jgi:hypothetical protein
VECRDPQPSFPLPAVSPVIRRVGSRQGEGGYRTLRAAASQLLKLPAPPPPPSDHGIPVGDLRPSGGKHSRCWTERGGARRPAPVPARLMSVALVWHKTAWPDLPPRHSGGKFGTASVLARPPDVMTILYSNHRCSEPPGFGLRRVLRGCGCYCESLLIGWLRCLRLRFQPHAGGH